MEPTSASLWALLGLVRFVLSLIVLSHHIGDHVVSGFFCRLGEVGSFPAVMIFLFISGYSISRSLQRDSDTRRFYLRRARRLYPLYSLALLFTVVFAWRLHDRFTWLDALQLSVFLQSWTLGLFPANGAVWTLGVEAGLYLCSPLWFRASFRTLLFLAFLSLAFFVAHDHLFTQAYFFAHRYGIAFFALAWLFLAGMLVVRFPERFRSPWPLALLSGAAYFAIRYWSPEPVAPVTLALGIWLVQRSPTIRFPERFHALANWLGELSYSIYLVQMPILRLLGALRFKSELPYFFIVFAAAVGMLQIQNVPVRLYRYLAGRVRTLPSETRAIALRLGVPFAKPKAGGLR